MVIDAFYSFKINGEGPYSVERTFKAGNNDIFNLLFENHHLVEITKLGPIEALNNYIAYTIKSLGKSLVPNPIIFATSTSLNGFGIVKTTRKTDGVIFKIIDYGEFEVYVFNNKYSSQPLLLQMLIDGLLDPAIEAIKSTY